MENIGKMKGIKNRKVSIIIASIWEKVLMTPVSFYSLRAMKKKLSVHCIILWAPLINYFDFKTKGLILHIYMHIHSTIHTHLYIHKYICMYVHTLNNQHCTIDTSCSWWSSWIIAFKENHIFLYAWM